MQKTIKDLLDEFFVSQGIAEDNLVNRMKQRNIRIQLCLKGVDAQYFEMTDNLPAEVVERSRAILAGLGQPMPARKQA